MRFIFSLALLFLSYSSSSMAWVDMAITSGEYLIWVRLIGDNDGVVEGDVTAETAEGKVCYGRYTLAISSGALSIALDRKNSGEMDEECARESMEVNIGPRGFSYLIDGHAIDGVMRSVLFNKEPRLARLQPIQLF